jgi:GGDEF domain-containing protein
MVIIGTLMATFSRERCAPARDATGRRDKRALMQPGVPRGRRARPIADAPIDALLARAEDLAKGWLVALVERAPLESAARIPVAELARDGPGVCEELLRALVSDRDLARIEPGGTAEGLVARAGELAGAIDAEATAGAVDALQGVLWRALRSELRDVDADVVADVSERLSLAAAVALGAALRRSAGEVHGAAPADAPWPSAIEDAVGRAEGSGRSLSLLLVELDEAERILAVEPPVEAGAVFGRFVRAVRSVMDPRAVIARETESRAWISVRDATRAEALALAERVAGAVQAEPPWRGARLTASVGVAVLGEDGRDAESLIAAAEEGRFAAAVSGMTVVGPGEAAR